MTHTVVLNIKTMTLSLMTGKKWRKSCKINVLNIFHCTVCFFYSIFFLISTKQYWKRSHRDLYCRVNCV